jgi:hypothetical protein
MGRLRRVTFMRDFFNVAFNVFLDVDPERRKIPLAILYATI